VYVHNKSKSDFFLEGRYTYFFSIINNKGLIGSTLNPKLANTTISFDETTMKFSWTPVENAEWYEVKIQDSEITSGTVTPVDQIFTSIPEGGITLQFDPANNLVDGYVKACSKYYTDSKTL
jgi:hypothetical protein